MYFNSLTVVHRDRFTRNQGLLKWIIVCHDKISTRFKVVFQRHIVDRSIFSSLCYALFHSFRVYDYVFLFFFFSFPKLLIKSVDDICGKNFLSKKKTLFYLYSKACILLFFFLFDITKIYSKIPVYMLQEIKSA